MAALNAFFCSPSILARALSSRFAARCSRPNTLMITGARRPNTIRMEPSPAPTNLLSMDASAPGTLPPNNDDRMRVPSAAKLVDEAMWLAMLAGSND